MSFEKKKKKGLTALKTQVVQTAIRETNDTFHVKRSFAERRKKNKCKEREKTARRISENDKSNDQAKEER